EEAVRSAGIKAPALIVVGEVVGLRPTLRWFEDRPLFGKRIVVTRAREQASDLIRRLSDLGADCMEVPTIRIVPPDSGGALDDAIDAIDGYDWIIFTSVNGVRFFFDRLFAKGGDARRLGHLNTAVIGPATADALRRFGLASDIVPENFRAESILEAFEAIDMTGRRVLLPRALEARAILPEELRKKGAVVDEVAAYRTVAEVDRAEALVEALENRSVDMVTFTSSSTVMNFMAMLPPTRAADLMDGVTVASIGPITTETAQSLGVTVHFTAETYTIPGLCSAICNHFRN
ncbi:MAG: uroporphyrinogen-III synthase, partial [Desulfobacterales bacterium]